MRSKISIKLMMLVSAMMILPACSQSTNLPQSNANQLIHNGSQVSSQLSNQQAESITNKYWKLKKLHGKTVTMTANQQREQYFIMRINGRLEGFAGCNQFSASYTVAEDTQRVKVGTVTSTLRACPDVQINETDFLEVFRLVDNYTIKDDVLMLNVGKRAPLAEFEAIYF